MTKTLIRQSVIIDLHPYTACTTAEIDKVKISQ